MILSLQTKSFACYGGIPTYNRLVCRVLNELDRRDGHCVLIAMDEREDVAREAALLPNLRLAGFGENRLKFVLQALRAVFTNKVELLLAGHVNYAPLGLFLSWLRPRMRYGVFIYGSEVWEKLPLLRRVATQQADFIVSISDYTGQQAVKINGIKKQNTFLLPNALEWSASDDAPLPHVDPIPGGIKLLSVGRLDANERQKGFDTVIKALPDIALEVPDVQYVIIGEGTDLDRHKQLADELAVSDRVHFLGSVNEELLRQYYRCCDVFVMPSAQEGFGFVYLEAMHYAKPVVAAKSGGAPEVVEDAITGRLVEYGNQAQLTQALVQLCNDPDERQRLGVAGYHRLNESFTYERFKQTLTDILHREVPSQMVEPTDRQQISTSTQS